MAIVPAYTLLREIDSPSHSDLVNILRAFLITDVPSTYSSIRWIESQVTVGSSTDLFIKSNVKNSANRPCYIEFYRNPNNNYALEVHQYHPDLFDPNIGNENFDTIDLSNYRNRTYDMVLVSAGVMTNPIFPNATLSKLAMINSGYQIFISIQSDSYSNTYYYNVFSILTGMLLHPTIDIQFYINYKNFNYTYSVCARNSYTSIAKSDSNLIRFATISSSSSIFGSTNWFYYPLSFGEANFIIDFYFASTKSGETFLISGNYIKAANPIAAFSKFRVYNDNYIAIYASSSNCLSVVCKYTLKI